jgi:predicted phosphoribosyltransferase
MPNFPAMKIIITIPLTQQLQLLELQKFSSQIHCLIFRSQFHSISSIFRQSSLKNKEEKKGNTNKQQWQRQLLFPCN